MKFSAALLFAIVGSANAFLSPSQKASFQMLKMSEPTGLEEVSAVATAETPVEPEKPLAPPLPAKSKALPFMDRPAMLDMTMPGDVGFDPLGFAKTKEDLLNFREAEIKHARLAMLAAAGWPLSELFDRKLATALNLKPLVDNADRAPSVLNGGLGKVPTLYWLTCLVAAIAIDFYGIKLARKNDPDYFPGNLGFDVLGLYPKDKAGQERMQLAEIKNGRLAMIAITAFAFQEFVTKIPVINETPMFFKPLGF